jgi:hypothetical protein
MAFIGAQECDDASRLDAPAVIKADSQRRGSQQVINKDAVPDRASEGLKHDVELLYAAVLSHCDSCGQSLGAGLINQAAIYRICLFRLGRWLLRHSGLSNG